MSSPFFIFYDSRSGSTFLSRLLVEKLGVVIPPESRFLPEFLSTNFSRFKFLRIVNFLYILSKDMKFKEWNLHLIRIFVNLLIKRIYDKKGMLNELYKYYAKSTNQELKSIGYFGFKKGSYQFHSPLIKELYPNAKFIYLVRDGRAVFNSKKTSYYPLSGLSRETDPTVAAKIWVDCLTNYELLKKKYKDSLILIKYEDVVLNTNHVIETLSDFLNIPKTSREMHTMYYKVPERCKTIHINIYKEPLVNRIDDFKIELTSKEIENYELVAGEHLKKYGYPTLTK